MSGISGDTGEGGESESGDNNSGDGAKLMIPAFRTHEDYTEGGTQGL